MRGAERRAVLIGLSGLAAFSAFFLVRPLVGPLSPYGPRPAGTTYAYSFVVVAAFVPYGLALWGSRQGVSLRTVLLGTALVHGLVLPAALTQSQDLYMYLFYGKMWAAYGADPYVVEPLRFAADPWFPWVRWPDQVSVYGPLWTLLSSVPAGLGAGSLPVAFSLAKGLVLVLIGAAVTGVVVAARSGGQAPGRPVLLAAWNPVTIVSLPLGGHADVAVAAALAWALAADRRGRPILAASLVAAAALVKAYAVVVLAVYLLALARRGRIVIPASAAVAGVTVAAFAPFWKGWATLDGLASVARESSASLAGEVQRALGVVMTEDVAGWVVRAVGLVVVAAVVVVTARREGFGDDPWPAASAAFLAYVLVTPWFLYWHQVGVVVLAALGASPAVRAAAITFTGTSMLTASFGATPLGRAVQAALRYGPPLAVFALAPRKTPRRSAVAPRNGYLKER